MTVRRQKARKGINSFIEEEENFQSDIGDDTDLDQAGNNKNPLQL